MVKIINKLNALRIKLDKINTSIASLLSERIEVVKKVAEAKQQTKNFYVPQRENSIFKNLTQEFEEIDPKILKSVFTEIMSGCRSYEKVFNVGLIKDVYSLSALTKILGSFTNNHYFQNIKSLIQQYNILDYIIIPVDNNFTTFIKNIQDVFIINSYKDENSLFLLLGKEENTDILIGKVGFVVSNEDINRIEKNLSEYEHIKYIQNEITFIEINYSSVERLKEIKELFAKVPHKYMGTYPDNDFLR